MKEQFFVFYNQIQRYDEEQPGLNYFAHGMGQEYLIEEYSGDMKHDCQQNISLGFIVYPVHNDDKGYHAEQKIDRIYPSRFDQVAVVITLNGR